MKARDRKEGFMKKIYIFGAHPRGRTLGVYLTSLYEDIQILAYLYDNDEENPKDVDGIPVIKIDSQTVLDADATVYIGTRGIFHEQIRKLLEQIGMQDIVPVTMDLDLDLRNRFLKKYYHQRGESFDKIDYFKAKEKTESYPKLTCNIYVAKSIYDSSLKSEYSLKKYEKEIQVGTALTEERIKGATVFDNVGDNISNRNRQFCELTAFYWLWKNATDDFIGLCHYRRHFILPEDFLNRMIDNQIHAILPVPLYVAPNLADNFRGRHAKKEWDCMMEYLKEYRFEEYPKMKEFFENTGLYSPCNMVILKKEVYHALCEWMFPILFYVANKCGEEANKYDNRYPGFLSERLISYFFEANKDKYKRVFADKNFLS